MCRGKVQRNRHQTTYWGLLSVRRRVVERALARLKKNNPHYAGIDIDMAEMDSWGGPLHGVPPQVCERMERNEPPAMSSAIFFHRKITLFFERYVKVGK